MKFVSSKKVVDHAMRYREIQEEIAELSAKIRELKEEKDSLGEFIGAKVHNESFQFSDYKGFLMEADFVPWTRKDINDEAVRRFYAKMGRKVPIKTSEGTHLKIKYVMEE